MNVPRSYLNRRSDNQLLPELIQKQPQVLSHKEGLFGTVLQHAVKLKKSSIVSLLIENNVDVNDTSNHVIEAPVVIACKNLDDECFNLLLNHPDIKVDKNFQEFYESRAVSILKFEVLCEQKEPSVYGSMYFSTIPTYNSHLNSHFLLSRCGNSFLRNRKWELRWEL